jgi:signal transduction histidine kinase
MKKITLSLNIKLIGITLIAFVIIVMLLMINEYKTITNANLISRTEAVIRLTESLKHIITSIMLKGECDDVKDVLASTAGRSAIGKLRVFDRQNGIILASGNAAEVGMSLPKEEYDSYQKHQDARPFLSKKNNVQYISIFKPIENSHDCFQCHPSNQDTLGVIQLQYSLTRSLASIEKVIINHVIFSLLAIILFALLFSYIVIKLIDDPLEKIMETIKYVEQGDLDKRVAVRRDDIIGKLSEKFNDMIIKRKEAREELEKYHRTQIMRASQLASIGELASGIAHEVKNPLACISSALQVIYGETDERSENKAVIKEVLHQVERLDHSVKRILEFARPVIVQKTTLDMDEVLEQTGIFLNQFANTKSIEISIAHGPGIKKIHGNADALQQLLLNICLNGIEAIEVAGSLTISSDIRMKETVQGAIKYIEVKIADTGCGIPREDLPRIFSPLFTNKKEGTGLGLAISAQIVEEHNGFFDVASIPGQGTVFAIYLPVREEGS